MRARGGKRGSTDRRVTAQAEGKARREEQLKSTAKTECQHDGRSGRRPGEQRQRERERETHQVVLVVLRTKRRAARARRTGARTGVSRTRRVGPLGELERRAERARLLHVLREELVLSCARGDDEVSQREAMRRGRKKADAPS